MKINEVHKIFAKNSSWLLFSNSGDIINYSKGIKPMWLFMKDIWELVLKKTDVTL